MGLKQLEQNDLKNLREELWLKNNKTCPLLGIEVELKDMVVDHIHKLKMEPASEQRGTVRNAIERRANALEGKITNNWRRYYGADESKHPIALPEFLRNLANYLEAGAYCDDGTYLIHPNEKPVEPKVSKSNYNKLKRVYDATGIKKKFPEYPKSKKLSKDLAILFEQFEINPFN